MNCPQCNATLPDGSKFCTECGSKLGAGQQQSQQQSQPQPPPTQQTAPQQTDPQQSQPQQPTPQQQSTPQQPPASNTQTGQQSASSSDPYIAPNIHGAKSQQNWLERLGNKIPGYRGYQEKEMRRDIDKLHR